MGTSKHTPGPWMITGVSIQTGNISVGCRAQRIVIADVTNAASFGDFLAGAMKRGGGGFAQSDAHTQYANANLIASAPDLLAALQKIAGGKEVEDPYHPEQTITVCWSAEEIDGICQDAIAKAEGR